MRVPNPFHRAQPDGTPERAIPVAQPSLALAYSIAMQNHTLKLERRIRRVLFVVGMLLVAVILPASPLHLALGYGGGGSAVLTITCGQPAVVFAKLLAGEKYTLPTKAQLMQLPTPQQRTIATPGDATYDPAKNELCAGGWVALDVRFVHPQPTVSGSTNFDPNFGFTGNTVDSTLSQLKSSSELWLRNAFQSIIDAASSFGFMFITPKALTYGHAVVQSLEQWMLLVMDSLLVLFLVIGGYNYMFGVYQHFRDLIPRLVVATIAANVSLFVLSQFIEASNTLCVGVLGVLAGAGIGDLQLPLGIINWATAPEYLLVVYLIAMLLAVVFSIQMLLRIALLDLLLVLAPLGLLCFALPQTRLWGSLWAQAFVATLISQFFQLLCLGLGAALIASTGHASLTPISILVGIAALFLAGKIPGMLLSSVMRSQVLGSGSKELGEQVVNLAGRSAEVAALVAA